MPRLVVTQGVDEGQQFEITPGPICIGRSAECAIRLLDANLASLHAEISQFRYGPEFEIVDISNGLGVVINGRLVQRAELKAGDQIQIGNTILSFVSDGAHTIIGPSLAHAPVVTRQGDDLPSRIIHTLSGDAQSTGLSVLFDTIHATTQIFDTDELAARVLELLFRTVSADRGCILLRDHPDAPLVPRAVRFRDGSSSRESIALSQTIVDHVLRRQQGVLVTDAGQDTRFRAGASIVRLGIREAICVPMSGRHETLGVLYFDSLRSDGTGHMTKSELSLAIAVARHAAIAVEDTRHFLAKVQSERLAAIGQAMAAMSHHVKNILQGMQSGHDVIKVGIAEKDFGLLANGWTLLEKNHQRIQDLVLDMLSYSKVRAPVLRPCSLGQITCDAVALFEGNAKACGAQVHLDFKPMPDTLADPESIHRVVLNLVGNAIDATRDEPHPAIDVRVYSDPNESFDCIAVHDNGPGIDPVQLPKLFQPFESTKGTRGTGLGLAISHKVAREHGGDLLVRNEPGRGCVFILRIPRPEAA